MHNSSHSSSTTTCSSPTIRTIQVQHHDDELKAFENNNMTQCSNPKKSANTKNAILSSLTVSTICFLLVFCIVSSSLTTAQLTTQQQQQQQHLLETNHDLNSPNSHIHFAFQNHPKLQSQTLTGQEQGKVHIQTQKNDQIQYYSMIDEIDCVASSFSCF